MSGEKFGDVLRRWRARRSLSVRALAGIAHYGKSYLSDLENGRPVRAEVARRLDEVLRADGELIAVAEADARATVERPVEQEGRAAGPHVALATQLLAESQEWGDMQRRNFVFGVGALAGLGLTVPPFALETARHGLISALVEQRADLTVDEWEAIVDEDGYRCMTTASAELLDSLMVDVLGIQTAIAQHGAGQQPARELCRSAALLATLVAEAVASSGQLRHTERWWRTARQVAGQSGDPVTEARVRGREVVHAPYDGRPLGQVLQLAEAAEALPPSRNDPWLVGGKAQALALAGRGPEALAELDRLRDLTARLPEASADPMSTFDWMPVRLRFTESFVYSHLGRLPEAMRAQDDALAAYPASFRRGPAQIELQRALCLVRGDDVTGGARHAQAVLTGLPPADLVRTVTGLAHQVHAAVPAGQRSRGEVTELRDCLAALKVAA